MKVTKVLNGFCKSGQHDKCPVKSKGTKSDRETFICVCDCHKHCGFCQGPCTGNHYVSQSSDGY